MRLRRRLHTWGAAAALAAGSSGCVVYMPPKEAAVPLGHEVGGEPTARGTPRAGQVEDVLLFAGRPTRPYEVRAFVATCYPVFGGSAFSTLREQADRAGADAVIELTDSPGDRCVSGVAVRLR